MTGDAEAVSAERHPELARTPEPCWFFGVKATNAATMPGQAGGNA